MTKANVLTVSGKAIPLPYATAHLHDNAEGLLDFPTELRILLTDVAPPKEALNGIVFDLPAEELAKAGTIRGLLLKLNPKDLGELRIVLLDKPEDQSSLLTHTLTSSGKDTIKNFRMADGFVSGVIEQSGAGESAFADMPGIAYSVAFRAEISKEPPVTADLKGKDAQNSAEAKIIVKKGEALEKKDFKALSALSTAAANRKHKVFLSNPDFLKIAPQAGAEMKKSVGKLLRVVERGNRAVAIFENKSWANFVREGSNWKSDD